jgi:hypothetical protein
VGQLLLYSLFSKLQLNLMAGKRAQHFFLQGSQTNKTDCERDKQKSKVEQ